MRIKINLESEPGTSIPIEYNYNVYLGIRKILLDFLGRHKPKLYNRYQKTLPDFTFSQLMIPDRKIEFGFIEITGAYLSFFVSSIDNTFMEYLIKAVNDVDNFSVHQKKFKLKKTEIIEEPEFTSPMKFRMMSPLLLVKREGNKVRFIRPDDSDLPAEFSAQLTEKYNQLYKTVYRPEEIAFSLDQDYLIRRKNLTRLLTIRNVNYKAILAPFRLEGEVDLIRFAYNNGIGAKTQMGLGMIEATGAK